MWAQEGGAAGKSACFTGQVSGTRQSSKEARASGRHARASLPARSRPPLLFETVVRRFLRDDYVVDVRLFEAGGADADEARLLLKLFDASAARVAHAGAQAADKLRDHLGECALVGHTAL